MIVIRSTVLAYLISLSDVRKRIAYLYFYSFFYGRYSGVRLLCLNSISSFYELYRNYLSIFNVAVSHFSIFDILIEGKLFLPCLFYFHVLYSTNSHCLSYIIIPIIPSVIFFKFYFTCVSYFHVFDSDVFQAIS